MESATGSKREDPHGGEASRLAQELLAVNREFDEFCRAVSHDLQAPIRRISQFAGILMEDHADSLNDEGKKIISRITENVKSMEGLILSLLSLSRTGRQEMRYSETGMTRLVRGVYDELAGRFPERDIRFTLNEMPPARCDAPLIREVFTRLLDNAIKFTSPGAQAVIEAGGRRESGELVYYVKDNGAGFDMRYAHKLFQVFQRLHGAGEFEGTGMGLATVRRIVHRHRGRVWAEGALGAGAVFYFALPVNPQDEQP